MPKGRLSFKKLDVTRAYEAAKAAGIKVSRVDISREGTISIISDSGGPRPVEPEAPKSNEWDEVLDENPTPVRR